MVQNWVQFLNLCLTKNEAECELCWPKWRQCEKHPRAFFLYRNKNWDTQCLNMQGGGGSLSDGVRG